MLPFGVVMVLVVGEAREAAGIWLPWLANVPNNGSEAEQKDQSFVHDCSLLNTASSHVNTCQTVCQSADSVFNTPSSKWKDGPVTIRPTVFFKSVLVCPARDVWQQGTFGGVV